MLVTSEQAVLVVVDVQERLLPAMHEATLLEKKLQTLLAGTRLLGTPEIVTQQYTQGLGSTVASLEARGFVEKSCFSCCQEEPFMTQLEESGRREVLLCGIESHICVLQTALELRLQGFSVTCVADAVSSRTPYDKEIALRRMEQEGIRLSTVESVLFMLCGTAKHEQFRAISRLIR